MTYMLDTNICAYIMNDFSQSVKSNAVAKYPLGLAISSITLAELRFGVAKSTAKAKHELVLNNFLKTVTILNFDESAAEEYGNIRAYLKGIGKPIGTMDMLIAAHAKSADLTVVTNNMREFERVPDLKLENWYEE